MNYTSCPAWLSEPRVQTPGLQRVNRGFSRCVFPAPILLHQRFSAVSKTEQMKNWKSNQNCNLSLNVQCRERLWPLKKQFYSLRRHRMLVSTKEEQGVRTDMRHTSCWPVTIQRLPEPVFLASLLCGQENTQDFVKGDKSIYTGTHMCNAFHTIYTRQVGLLWPHYQEHVYALKLVYLAAGYVI